MKRLHLPLPMIVIEGLLLLIGLVYLFMPLHNLSYSGPELEASGWRLTGISLPAGNYIVTTGQTATAYEDAWDQVEAGATVSSCVIESAGHPLALTKLVLELKPGHDTTTSILPVRPFGRVDDMSIEIDYTEMGVTSFEWITIRESRRFRAVLLAALFLILLLIDGLFLLYRKDRARFHRALGLLLITLLASIPIFRISVNYGHDLYFHLGRIDGIAYGLKSGQFPVRMYVSHLNYYGYASPIFYGDLPLYLPALLYLCAVPLDTAYKVYILMVNAGTVLICYFAFSRMFQKHFYGLLGALVYSVAPYRMFTLHTRHGVGEYTAMMFLPLIVYGFWRILFAKGKLTLRDSVPLALGLTGLIQTHMLSCEMSAVVILLFCLLHIRDVTRPPIFFALLKSCGLTILINLTYLVPFFDFMQDDYSIVSELLTSLQGLALSLSDQMIHIVIGMVLIVGFLFAFRKMRNREGYYLGTVLLLGFVTLLMTGRNFPWDTIAANAGPLSYYIWALQFPMRYLTMTTICFTVAFLGILRVLSGNPVSARVAKTAVAVLCAIPILYVGYYYYDLLPTSVGLYMNGHSEMEALGRLIVSGGEYLPEGMETATCISRDAQPDSNVTVESCVYDNGKLYLTAQNTSDASGEVAVPLIYYRHYSAVDTATGADYEISSSEDHLVSVTVPSGYDGTMVIRFREPWYYRLSELASLATLLVILCLYRRRATGLPGESSAIAQKTQ